MNRTHVTDELRAIETGLPANLRRVWRRFADDRGVSLGASASTQPLPRDLPVLSLCPWTADFLREHGAVVGDEDVLNATVSAVLGYAMVRLQDDRLDEALGDEDTALLLGTTLYAHHVARLTAVAGPAIGPLLVQAWQDYAEAMLVERQPDAWTEARWRQSLGRYAPLWLAPAALLLAHGKPEVVPDLQRLAVALAEAHQLGNDALDAVEDSEAGRTTWATTRFATGTPISRGAWLLQVLPDAFERTEQLWQHAALEGRWLPGFAAYAHRRVAVEADILGRWRADTKPPCSSQPAALRWRATSVLAKRPGFRPRSAFWTQAAAWAARRWTGQSVGHTCRSPASRFPPRKRRSPSAASPKQVNPSGFVCA